MFTYFKALRRCSSCKNLTTSLHQKCGYGESLIYRNARQKKVEHVLYHVSSFQVGLIHGFCQSSPGCFQCSQLQKSCYSSAIDHSVHQPKRITRKKKTKDSLSKDQEMFDVIAYSTADKYNLCSLRQKLKEQGLYGHIALPSDMSEEALFVESLYGVEEEPRNIFFFKDGATVFWNVPQVERISVLKYLHHHQEKPYDQDLVNEEYDKMNYTYDIGSSHLHGDEIVLRKAADKADLNKQQLEKYAFSNALALSVSLSIWEAMLDEYVESIEFILQDLKDGKNIRMTETDVLRKAGHLLTLRHLINLRSDLLDPPDAYWDREDLELIYIKTCQYLDIARRTRVMNEKLNHCTELTTMLQELLKDKHHTRLEWMIIILIMIEVVFEVIHACERWQDADQSQSEK